MCNTITYIVHESLLGNRDMTFLPQNNRYLPLKKVTKKSIRIFQCHKSLLLSFPSLTSKSYTDTCSRKSTSTIVSIHNAIFCTAIILYIYRPAHIHTGIIYLSPQKTKELKPLWRCTNELTFDCQCFWE